MDCPSRLDRSNAVKLYVGDRNWKADENNVLVGGVERIASQLDEGYLVYQKQWCSPPFIQHTAMLHHRHHRSMTELSNPKVEHLESALLSTFWINQFAQLRARQQEKQWPTAEWSEVEITEELSSGKRAGTLAGQAGRNPAL